MKNKRKVLAASLICVLIVICSGIGILLVINQEDSNASYQKQIQTADKYFAEGDYENAIIAYTAAMNESDKEVKPYQRLTIIYLSQNEITLAENILSTGIAKTSSLELQKMWAVYFGENAQLAVSEDSLEGKQLSKKETAVNRQLLSEIASSTFYDYRMKYGEPSIHKEGMESVVAFGNTGISYYYYNTADNSHIVDNVTGEPYGQSKANEASFQNLSLIFSGMEDSLDYKTLSKLDVRSLKKGYEKESKRYTINFLCGGCSITIESDKEGNILSSDAWNKVVPIETENSENIFEVEGQVVDATTGLGISGASVKIRKEDTQTGEVLSESTTSTDGSYTVDLESGDYFAEVSMDGYLTEYFEVFVDLSGELDENQFTISPMVESGQIRIVLEWGNLPSDLDSYLEGNLSDGTSVFINYRHKSLQKDGEDIITLDVDDRDGYGPETITINDINGSYHFHVVDFLQEGTLGINGATVKVYMPNEKAPTVLEVPSDVENFWDVLNIEQGVLTINNCAWSPETVNNAK